MAGFRFVFCTSQLISSKKKMNLTTFKTQKKNEFNHWTFFSAYTYGSGRDPSLGFKGQNFVVSSNLGSVRLSRPGFRTAGGGSIRPA